MSAALGVILAGFAGTEPPAWLLRKLDAGLGGVVLFGRNVGSGEQVAELVSALHAQRPGMLVAIDEEAGDVTRLEAASGSSYPGNLALGSAGDPELTCEVAAAIGGELASLGIDLDLAPVADVNSDPGNPVIGVRSFGSEPALVAEHAAAFVRGLQSRGVAACLKHFPGHGATHQDSHLELPTVDLERETFEAESLPPFAAGVAAGARAVMTAHIRVPGLDDAPATISRPIITGLLRERLGFGGCVITDGMDMKAIADGVGTAEGAARAVEAGVDAVCLGGWHVAESGVDEVAARLERVDRDRLEQAAGRVAGLAEWAVAHRRPGAGRPELGFVAARRAVRAEGDARLGPRVVVVELDPAPPQAVGVVPWGLGPALAAAGRAPHVLRVGEDGDLPGLNGAADVIVVVRDLHRHPWQRRVLGRLLQLRPDAVVVEMGVPVERPSGGRAYLATFGAGRPNAAAAVERMLAP